jgi:hypothetical protein
MRPTESRRAIKSLVRSTIEQLESQLPAAEVTLTADILDRIDQLVAPGVTINPDDNSYGEAELTPTALRRTS